MLWTYGVLLTCVLCKSFELFLSSKDLHNAIDSDDYSLTLAAKLRDKISKLEEEYSNAYKQFKTVKLITTEANMDI